MDREDQNMLVGTPNFMAPQIFQEDGAVGIYKPPIDMWSLGVTMFQMITGQLPFQDLDVKEQIMTQEPRYDHFQWKKFSPECIDLVKKLLIKDPLKRLTAQ